MSNRKHHLDKSRKENSGPTGQGPTQRDHVASVEWQRPERGRAGKKKNFQAKYSHRTPGRP